MSNSHLTRLHLDNKQHHAVNITNTHPKNYSLYDKTHYILYSKNNHPCQCYSSSSHRHHLAAPNAPKRTTSTTIIFLKLTVTPAATFRFCSACRWAASESFCATTQTHRSGSSSDGVRAHSPSPVSCSVRRRCFGSSSIASASAPAVRPHPAPSSSGRHRRSFGHNRR